MVRDGAMDEDSLGRRLLSIWPGLYGAGLGLYGAWPWIGSGLVLPTGGDSGPDSLLRFGTTLPLLMVWA